jgi:putative ABC transport system permease protein
MREFWSKLRSLLTGRRPAEEELAEEMQAHLAMETDRALEDGLSPEEARLAARRRLGNSAAIAERARDSWTFPSFESLLKDFGYGFRALRRAPVFTLIVVLTLAAGIGLNTAIFSIVHTVLLKPLPYPAAERLVWFGELIGRAEGVSVTWVNFKYWRDGNHSFETMAARLVPADLTLTSRGDPQVTHGLLVTAPYFSLLGMKPLHGRLFGEADDRGGADPVVVLNHRFWVGSMGADPRIVGASLTLNGTAYRVVGVTAPLWEPGNYDFYLPLGRQNAGLANRAQHGPIRMIGRLKPGITLAAARADLDGIMRHLAEVDPGPESTHRSFGKFWAEDIVGDERGTLLVLMKAAGLILLIACANVASLLLARNTTRSGELAVRMAIGAGRLRLTRQLLTENLILAAAGGCAGIAVAWAALRGFIALAPHEIPRLAQTRLDLPVLLFATALTLGAGLLAGLAPVLAAGKPDVTSALKEGLRLAGGGRRRQSMRNLLVIAEVALTFVLAFGSGLLLRSLIAAQNAPPGYDPAHVLTFSLRLLPADSKDRAAVAQFYQRLLTDLRTIPGVAGASSVFCGPGAGNCGDWWYSVPGFPVPARNEVPMALTNTADTGYFRMMRIPLIEGREFDERDRGAGNPVIVNQTIARRWWPHEPAVGHQIKLGGPYLDGPALDIVGVVGDIKQFERDTESWPEMYSPFAAEGPVARTIVLRSAGDPEALVPAIRERVRALNPKLPLQKVATLEHTLGAGLARRRFSTVLLTLFAALAMLLAAIGIYGLLSYWVSVREAEIAIRLALGASPSAIVRWTGMHALRLTAIGVGLGWIGGWAAAAALETMVFGIPPRSPAMMLAAVAAVGAIAFVATAIPAWRAGRVDVAGRLHHG